MDCCRGFRVHGDRMGVGGDIEFEPRCRRVCRLGCPACNQCPHARGHQPAGRNPGDFHLARGALCFERPVERAWFHGLCGRTADVSARCYRLADCVRLSPPTVRFHALHVRQPDRADIGSFRRLPRSWREDRCSRTTNGFCTALCQQLLLDDHASGRRILSLN